MSEKRYYHNSGGVVMFSSDNPYGCVRFDPGAEPRICTQPDESYFGGCGIDALIAEAAIAHWKPISEPAIVTESQRKTELEKETEWPKVYVFSAKQNISELRIFSCCTDRAACWSGNKKDWSAHSLPLAEYANCPTAWKQIPLSEAREIAKRDGGWLPGEGPEDVRYQLSNDGSALFQYGPGETARYRAIYGDWKTTGRRGEQVFIEKFHYITPAEAAAWEAEHPVPSTALGVFGNNCNSYVRNCLFVSRSDQIGPAFRQQADGSVTCALDGYAIIPKEQYDEHCSCCSSTPTDLSVSISGVPSADAIDCATLEMEAEKLKTEARYLKSEIECKDATLKHQVEHIRGLQGSLKKRNETIRELKTRQVCGPRADDLVDEMLQKMLDWSPITLKDDLQGWLAQRVRPVSEVTAEKDEEISILTGVLERTAGKFQKGFPGMFPSLDKLNVAAACDMVIEAVAEKDKEIETLQKHLADNGSEKHGLLFCESFNYFHALGCAINAIDANEKCTCGGTFVGRLIEASRNIRKKDEELAEKDAEIVKLRDQIEHAKEYDARVPDPRQHKYFDHECGTNGCKGLRVQHQAEEITRLNDIIATMNDGMEAARADVSEKDAEIVNLTREREYLLEASGYPTDGAVSPIEWMRSLYRGIAELNEARSEIERLKAGRDHTWRDEVAARLLAAAQSVPDDRRYGDRSDKSMSVEQWQQWCMGGAVTFAYAMADAFIAAGKVGE